jgi:hypothetical protein
VRLSLGGMTADQKKQKERSNPRIERGTSSIQNVNTLRKNHTSRPAGLADIRLTNVSIVQNQTFGLVFHWGGSFAYGATTFRIKTAGMTGLIWKAGYSPTIKSNHNQTSWISSISAATNPRVMMSCDTQSGQTDFRRKKTWVSISRI